MPAASRTNIRVKENIVLEPSPGNPPDSVAVRPAKARSASPSITKVRTLLNADGKSVLP